MKKLYNYLEQLKSFIPKSEVVNSSQSSGSVGWHIQHCLLVINQIVEAMQRCNLSAYKNKRSLIKSAIFTFGIIPRGKVTSPEAVRPAGDITQEQLRVNAANTKLLLKQISGLSNDAYFKHPMLGHIKLRPAIRFLSIHTYHHLKIINDIIRRNK